MKASLKFLVLALGLVLLVPSAAQAQAPLLSPIPNLSVNADASVTVNVTAVDVGGRLITLGASLPSFGTLNTPTSGTGTVTTSLTLSPSGVNVGSYTAAVTASVAGESPSLRVFQIMVNIAGSDRAPTVSAPALQEVTVGSTLSFFVSASDPDGDAIESLVATGLPAGATFAPNGAFGWTPGAGDDGEYDVLFTASNALSGVGVTHIRVATAPTLTITPIADVTVEGGENAFVPVHAAGQAGALITLTASLPSFATLNPPGTGTGVVNTTITISPPVGSAGTYHASVTATSNGVSVTENFDINVTGSGGGENRAPVLSAPAARSVDVGTNLNFLVTATDPDGDHVDLFGSGLPPGSGFVDNANNTGTFTWTPTMGHVGGHLASFTGLDNRGGSGSASTMITVNGANGQNHAPVLSAPASQTVVAGSTLTFDVTASDSDGDHVDLAGSGLPAGANFVDDGDNTGTFTWSPTSGQTGTQTASFMGSDGRGGNASATTSITVTAAPVENRPPTVTAPLTRQVNEGVNLSFQVTASDPDGDDVALSAGSVPDGATFADQNDNTGSFSWTPSSTQSGTYDVTFTGDDGRGGTDAATTTITVTDVPPANRPPTVSAPMTLEVNEGVNLSFLVTATDPDGDHVTLSAGSVPDGATFADQNNNTGSFSWTPSSTQSGTYDVTFTGDDGRGGTDAATTTITVNNVGTGTVPGKACLIGEFKHKTTCFRINPVNGSFDLRDVVLSSITLHYKGKSVPALSDGTQIERDCHRGGHVDRDDDDDDDGDRHGDGDRDDDDDDGDRRGDGRDHRDDAVVSLTGGHPHGGGHDRDDDDKDLCGVRCEDKGKKGKGHDKDRRNHHDNDDCGRDENGAECDTLGIRACFSTNALLALFKRACKPCDLLEAEIHATLTNGATMVATFGNRRPHDDDDDRDKDKDRDKDDGDHRDDRDARNGDGRGKMRPKVRPNPVNPMTVLSFTLVREGRVQVTVYDMRGRLVKSLMDEFRSAGDQMLAWDGSNAQSQRVASGVYFFRIKAPEGEVVQRVAVVK